MELLRVRQRGPWQIVGSFPTSIDPGTSADVTIKFTAQSAPTLQYNETNGTTNGTRAGAWVGSLTFNTSNLMPGSTATAVLGPPSPSPTTVVFSRAIPH